MVRFPHAVILTNAFFVTISHQMYSQKGQSALWNLTNVDLLKRNLLYGYDKYTRPAHVNTSVTVDLTLDINHIHVDDIKYSMTVQGIFKMEWNDFRLRWHPENYAGLASIALSRYEIWIPDPVNYYSATVKDMDHYGDVPCLVNANGNVICKPPALFSPYCSFSHTYWPFDNQSCKFPVGTYAYSGFEISLTNNEGYTKSTEDYATNVMSEWEIVSVRERLDVVYYMCCPEPWETIDYKIVVRRVASSLIFIVILPAIVVTLLTLSLFWLPIVGHERLILSSLIISVICINFLCISNCLPFMGKTTPRIVVFYTIDLLMVVIALIASAFMLGICNIRTPLPKLFVRVIRGRAGKILCIQGIKGEQEDDTNQGMFDISKNPSVQWFEVAKAMNRIFSVLYIIFFIYLGMRITD